GDAVPRLREDQRARRRGDRGVVKEMRDAALRDRALDVRRSFIVQAPPGAGQTDLLVRRFLKLLNSLQKPAATLGITLTKEPPAGRLKDRARGLRKTGEAPTRAELEATLASERNRLLARAKALYPRATEALARGYLTQKGEWTKRPAAPKELVSIPGLREALF